MRKTYSCYRTVCEQKREYWLYILLMLYLLTSLHIRPQGAYHNVVRWVHRSSFSIRPPNKYSAIRTPSLSSMHGHVNLPKGSKTGQIPIPGTDDLYVHPGWCGTIVVETEGTNESLADLQDRCGPGIFPPRVRGAHSTVTQAQLENRKVYRILRERRCVFFFPSSRAYVYNRSTFFFQVGLERYGSSVSVSKNGFCND